MRGLERAPSCENPHIRRSRASSRLNGHESKILPTRFSSCERNGETQVWGVLSGARVMVRFTAKAASVQLFIYQAWGSFCGKPSLLTPLLLVARKERSSISFRHPCAIWRCRVEDCEVLSSPRWMLAVGLANLAEGDSSGVTCAPVRRFYSHRHEVGRWPDTCGEPQELTRPVLVRWLAHNTTLLDLQSYGETLWSR